jgi:hypothetical protein
MQHQHRRKLLSSFAALVGVPVALETRVSAGFGSSSPESQVNRSSRPASPLEARPPRILLPKGSVMRRA